MLNYRPISIPSCLLRPITKRLADDMSAIVERTGLLGNLQFGFRPNHCTQDAIYVLSSLIQKCKKSRTPYHAMFIDITKAYDSVDRKHLYQKLKHIGMGGKVLSLIQSMYHNDCLRFLILGRYSVPLFLLAGLRQGCNLSPLLFAIFIASLSPELLSSKIGIHLLPGCCIPLILFADDIVLIAVSKEELDTLFSMTRKYFQAHNLQISIKKTKLFTSPLGEGEIIYHGDSLDETIGIEIISSFKYLGIQFNSRPYKLFSDYNANVSRKCDFFLNNILSITKTNYDKSFMALTLWNNIALPSILYGVECLPLNENTIKKIEVTQNKIGKFALQVPVSTANIQVAIDAGLTPIRFLICQRVLQYVSKLRNKPRYNFASDCYSMSVLQNDKFNSYVNSQLQLLVTSPHFPCNIAKVVKLSVHAYLKNNIASYPSCFAISVPGIKDIGSPKFWVSDSSESRSFARFRAMSADLGNKYPNLKGFYSPTCVFCQNKNIVALNNEVHLVIECPHFLPTRRDTILEEIISTMQGTNLVNNIAIYKFLLDDKKSFHKEIRSALNALLCKWHEEIDNLLERDQ